MAAWQWAVAGERRIRRCQLPHCRIVRLIYTLGTEHYSFEDTRVPCWDGADSQLAAANQFERSRSRRWLRTDNRRATVKLLAYDALFSIGFLGTKSRKDVL